MAERFPIFKGAIYNTTKPENTNFFANDLTPTDAPSIFLIYFSTLEGGPGGIPSVKRTNGSNIVIERRQLQFTNSVYVIQTLVAPGDSINLIMPSGSGSCGVGTLIIIEIDIATRDLFSRNVVIS